MNARLANPAATSLPLWPLPLLAALLMLIGASIATYLAMQQQLIPTCNPLWEGCVSISRAGRYGLPNILFRALLLPSAVLQALTWVMCSRWLLVLRIAPSAIMPGTVMPSAHVPNATMNAIYKVNWLAILGVTAGILLILYGSFLGTEGATYRVLRQYGTVGYFGFSYLCMLMLLRDLRRAVPLPCWPAPLLLTICAVLLILGLTNTVVATLFSPSSKDRIENVSEWWLGIGFVAVFVLLAHLWRRLSLNVRLDMASGA